MGNADDTVIEEVVDDDVLTFRYSHCAVLQYFTSSHEYVNVALS